VHDIADAAEIDEDRRAGFVLRGDALEAAGREEPIVAPRKSDGAAAVLTDESDDLPPSTISTTSMVSSSVMRSPPEKFDLIPTRSSI
jgi:hypothetical protein